MTHVFVFQQASVMESYGLKGLVINSDTIHDAQLQGEDIWKKAETEPSIVFLSPEQLSSPGFGDLSKDDSTFATRVCVIAVDEAHLLNSWGASWRKSFRQTLPFSGMICVRQRHADHWRDG